MFLIRRAWGRQWLRAPRVSRHTEAHGLVERTVFAVVPPKVEYLLTRMGESINEPLAALCTWVERNGAAMERGLARHAAASRSG